MGDCGALGIAPWMCSLCSLNMSTQPIWVIEKLLFLFIRWSVWEMLGSALRVGCRTCMLPVLLGLQGWRRVSQTRTDLGLFAKYLTCVSPSFPVAKISADCKQGSEIIQNGMRKLIKTQQCRKVVILLNIAIFCTMLQNVVRFLKNAYLALSATYRTKRSPSLQGRPIMYLINKSLKGCTKLLMIRRWLLVSSLPDVTSDDWCTLGLLIVRQCKPLRERSGWPSSNSCSKPWDLS